MLYSLLFQAHMPPRALIGDTYWSRLNRESNVFATRGSVNPSNIGLEDPS